MTPWRTWLPAPLLSLALFVIWLLLARSAGAGHVILGLALAVAVPRFAPRLRLSDVRVRHPGRIARFAMRVVGDVVVSNLLIARDVILWRSRQPASRFIVIPLELRDPAGLAALALVTTIVPGTVWSELAIDRSALLLHVWDADEERAFIARFKARYEQPLREIFES